MERQDMVKHDEQLVVLSKAAQSASQRSEWTCADAMRAAGFRHLSRNDMWVDSEGHMVMPHTAWKVLPETSAARIKHEAAKQAEMDAWDTVELHEKGYSGWNRFYLVLNNNGHIHRSMSCSTCYPTTTYSFLTGLSGTDDATVVADQGEILCSVCFPDAPVAWTMGESKASIAAKAERAAAKVAREAAKAAKAERNLVTYDDGPVPDTGDRWCDLSKLTDARSYLDSAVCYGGDRFPHKDRVARALAVKLGTTPEKLIAKYEKKYR